MLGIDENLFAYASQRTMDLCSKCGLHCITRLRFFKAVIIQSQKLLLYYVWYSKVGKQQLGKITPWGQCRPPHGTVEKGAFSKMQRQCALFPIFQVVSEKKILFTGGIMRCRQRPMDQLDSQTARHSIQLSRPVNAI